MFLQLTKNSFSVQSSFIIADEDTAFFYVNARCLFVNINSLYISDSRHTYRGCIGYKTIVESISEMKNTSTRSLRDGVIQELFK